MGVADIIHKFISQRNLLESSKEDMQLFMEYYNSRVFSVKDTLITPKRFHDWLHEGLLPMEIPEGKKNLMSLPEFIWVKLIDRLRQVGIPLEHIRELKEYLFRPLDFQFLNSELADDSNARAKVGKLLDTSGLSAEERQLLEEELESETPFAKLGDFRQTAFDSVLIRLLTTDDEAGIMLMPNGYFRFWLESTGEPRMNLTHVYLSISEELNLFRSQRLWEQRAAPLNQVTDQEWQVIWAIRNKRAKEITITFVEKGVERRMDITTTSKEQISLEDTDKVLELVRLGKFSEVSLKTQDGKIIHAERKKRKRV